jgi:2-polyprenyl-6-hydroxyphenyl methylase/3-demethylubiquinone-9 3-methyltransferase
VGRPVPVNNALYDVLGPRWYEAEDDPVALLRAESRLIGPWVAERMARLTRPARPTKIRGAPEALRVLDVGCGGGFLSNRLAREGHAVTGVDRSASSLHVARRYDATGRVAYSVADALALPFADGAFDVVAAMDFLEHVEQPARVVAEAARVLAPGGLFFFHTFNRNWVAGLVAIKFLDWFVPNTPPHLHVLRLFVTPDEMRSYCAQVGLCVEEMVGTRAHLLSWPALRLLLTGRVSPSFRFSLTRSLRIAYLGVAVKDGVRPAARGEPMGPREAPRPRDIDHA